MDCQNPPHEELFVHRRTRGRRIVRHIVQYQQGANPERMPSQSSKSKAPPNSSTYDSFGYSPNGGTLYMPLAVGSGRMLDRWNKRCEELWSVLSIESCANVQAFKLRKTLDREVHFSHEYCHSRHARVSMARCASIGLEMFFCSLDSSWRIRMFFGARTSESDRAIIIAPHCTTDTDYLTHSVD